MPHISLEAGRDANRKYYEANKAKFAARNKAKQQEFVAIIHTHKSKPCADCKVQYPYYVMDFDHLGDKKFEISQRGNISSVKKLLDEIAKCDVVCSNCHRTRTWQRMQCPQV